MSNDPTTLMLDIASGIFSAFTALLGLVVYVKCIFAMLNVRTMIDWSM